MLSAIVKNYAEDGSLFTSSVIYSVGRFPDIGVPTVYISEF